MGYKADPKDIVIVIVGPTGSGKTRFIEALSGGAQPGGTGRLKAHTKRVTPHVISYNGSTQQIPGRLVLVDTPGLNDGSCPDAMQLRKIFDKLKAKYSQTGRPLQLAGIIYLHQITDNRLSKDSICKKPRSLRQLGCDTPVSQVRLVTTMWNKLGSRTAGENREQELISEYWRPAMDEGAVTERFDDTPDAAWGIITGLLGQSYRDIQPRRPTQIEVEAYDDVPRCFGFC